MLIINNTLLINNYPPHMSNTYKHILYSGSIYYGETYEQILQTPNDWWIKDNGATAKRKPTQSMDEQY